MNEGGHNGYMKGSNRSAAPRGVARPREAMPMDTEEIERFGSVVVVACPASDF